jgi:hypothetical protein
MSETGFFEMSGMSLHNNPVLHLKFSRTTQISSEIKADSHSIFLSNMS